MQEEGYIKFTCDWIQEPISLFKEFKGLNNIRLSLYQKRLIGVLDNGVGFGNISARLESGEGLFVITGSATGGKSHLSIDDYSIVLEADIEDNYVKCKGVVKASSESMSHFAVYTAQEGARCVIHVHDEELWDKMKGRAVNTTKKAEYGSVLLAKEIMSLAGQNEKEIVMLGHYPGLLFWGESIDDAYNRLLKWIE